MVEELEGAWNFLKLIEGERDTVETNGLKIQSNSNKERCWLMARLLTGRPFNKEAMIGTFRVVWRLAKKFDVSIIDSNLFFV
ncbi:hypothetical protein PTKIN_Ptkin05aG0138500 [Pterospermum kingtungense]